MAHPDSFGARSTLDVGGTRPRDLPTRRAAAEPRHHAAPVHAARAPRERAPDGGRRRRDGCRRRGRRRLGGVGGAVAGDLLHARPRAAAGLHGRAGRRRSRGDEKRHARPRGRSAEDQSAPPCRARDRPLRAGGRVRDAARHLPQRRARVPAEPRALRLPALGPRRLRQLQGRPAEHRDRPPGEPRVPRAGRGRAQRHRVPRHARRHRLAHDDDQRARRAGLGRRRDRSRGCDARRGDLDARTAGRRLPAHRRASRRLDGDRPRAHGDADPPQDRRRREVRRVLRARSRDAAARRSRDHREHVAGVRGDLRVLPRRRRDASLSPAHRSARGADRARRGVLQGERAVARPGRAAHVLADRGARPVVGRAVAGRAAAPAGPRPAPRREAGVPRRAAELRCRLRERARRSGRRDVSRERPARISALRATKRSGPMPRSPRRRASCSPSGLRWR